MVEESSHTVQYCMQESRTTMGDTSRTKYAQYHHILSWSLAIHSERTLPHTERVHCGSRQQARASTCTSEIDSWQKRR